MNPQEIYQALEKGNFPNFHRADIILTNHLGNFFSRLIRIKAILKDELSFVSHAEKYIVSGITLGADKYGLNFKPLEKFFDGSYNVYVFSNIKLLKEERDLLFRESMNAWLKWHGKPYDVFGILWQLLDTLFVTDWFSRKWNSDKLIYCNEFVQRMYAILKMRISYHELSASTPNDIYEYISSHKEWKCVFKMERIAGEWRVEQ
jgi:hypothetical protein